VYDATEAEKLAAHTTWAWVRDGEGFRRAVPSPAPRRIREIKTIRLLVRAAVTVICAGGGGIPVVVSADGALRGVEAVIDKDLSAALLAEEIGADALLLLTDVPAVWTSWPKSEGEPIRHATPAALRAFNFDPGSMGPKVEAACRFAERTGRTAGIGALEQAEDVLAGTAGTIVGADAQ
jgi:carbamate kinase